MLNIQQMHSFGKQRCLPFFAHPLCLSSSLIITNGNMVNSIPPLSSSLVFVSQCTQLLSLSLSYTHKSKASTGWTGWVKILIVRLISEKQVRSKSCICLLKKIQSAMWGITAAASELWNYLFKKCSQVVWQPNGLVWCLHNFYSARQLLAMAFSIFKC